MENHNAMHWPPDCGCGCRKYIFVGVNSINLQSFKYLIFCPKSSTQYNNERESTFREVTKSENPRNYDRKCGWLHYQIVNRIFSAIFRPGRGRICKSHRHNWIPHPCISIYNSNLRYFSGNMTARISECIRAFHQFKLITPFHFNLPEFHQHPLHAIVLALQFLLYLATRLVGLLLLLLCVWVCVATNLQYKPDGRCKELYCCCSAVLRYCIALSRRVFFGCCWSRQGIHLVMGTRKICGLITLRKRMHVANLLVSGTVKLPSVIGKYSASHRCHNHV